MVISLLDKKNVHTAKVILNAKGSDSKTYEDDAIIKYDYNKDITYVMAYESSDD
jgi:hypothetical protein